MKLFTYIGLFQLIIVACLSSLATSAVLMAKDAIVIEAENRGAAKILVNMDLDSLTRYKYD